MKGPPASINRSSAFSSMGGATLDAPGPGVKRVGARHALRLRRGGRLGGTGSLGLGARRSVGLGQQRLEALLAGQDLREGLAKVGTRVDAHPLAGAEERERVGGAAGTDLVADEEPRFAIQNPGAKTAF